MRSTIFLSFCCFIISIGNTVKSELPEPNYMFSNYDTGMYHHDDLDNGHHEEFTVNAVTGSHTNGDDYGYTDLSPKTKNPFNGPAQTMTHSYSPPSVNLGPSELTYGYHVEPERTTPAPLLNPLKGFKEHFRRTKFRIAPPSPPPPPPIATAFGANLDNSYGNQGSFGSQGYPGEHFSNHHTHIFTSPYSTLHGKKEANPPKENSIHSFFPTKSKTFMRPTTLLSPPSHEHLTYDTSPETLRQPHQPFRKPGPSPRGKAPGKYKGPSFSFSFRKPHPKDHHNHHHEPHIHHISLSYKGYMPPPPVEPTKKPYGYTSTSYDGTGLITHDLSNRRHFTIHPPAQMTHSGGYNLDTSYYY